MPVIGCTWFAFLFWRSTHKSLIHTAMWHSKDVTLYNGSLFVAMVSSYSNGLNS